MKYTDLKEYIISGKIDNKLKQIICDDDVSEERKRYIKPLDEAYAMYGDGDYHFVSSPGRSEIGGNHTDHQHGNVVCAGLSIDNICVVKKNDDNTVHFKDADFVIAPVDLNDLEIHEEQFNSSESLIRGIAASMSKRGYDIGGFDCLCNSRVLVGSGISSSACFEMMIAEVFNSLYNNDRMNPIERAIIGQYAENVYFGKPSGLMDQMAISVGGFVTIDFKNPDDPVIENFSFSFADHGYEMVIVNTKGDHADLSYEYAGIPNEIKKVADVLGVEYLADTSKEKFLDNFMEIRKKVNDDRAMLRSLHFFNENERAIRQKEAIRNNDIDELLKLMNESAKSSYEYLQNVYPSSRPFSQSLAVGLALADDYLERDGVARVHGGGFEGTIQCIVPEDKMAGFEKLMCSVFGDDCLLKVRVRSFGTAFII
ncbi:MAG: galactokinase family protein [Erysipelotrichaceae bacterium]|nr:galactokinase family protein [Erysipelotrichaceae bacterium]